MQPAEEQVRSALPGPCLTFAQPNGKLALLGTVLETDVQFDPRVVALVEAKEAERLNNQKNKGAREGFCVECEDQAATVACNQCNDVFCFLCYQSQHRKGKRATHTTKSLVTDQQAPAAGPYSAYFPSIAFSFPKPGSACFGRSFEHGARTIIDVSSFVHSQAGCFRCCAAGRRCGDGA